jgi:hypothetical protein
MKEIILLKDKLLMEIPEFYESRYDYYGILEIYYPKGKFAMIKFLIIDSTVDNDCNKLYNDIKNKGFTNKISENIYYSVYNHSFELNNEIFYVTSFEIIFKKYYINIRVNTLEELVNKDREDLIKHIHKIILSIKEI